MFISNHKIAKSYFVVRSFMICWLKLPWKFANYELIFFSNLLDFDFHISIFERDLFYQIVAKILH